MVGPAYSSTRMRERSHSDVDLVVVVDLVPSDEGWVVNRAVVDVR